MEHSTCGRCCLPCAADAVGSQRGDAADAAVAAGKRKCSPSEMRQISRAAVSEMGKFDSDRSSSPGGGSKFKSGASGIKKHAGSGKRHASEAPTGKFGFARLKNDDIGDVDAGARDRVSGGGQNRGLASNGSSKKNKNQGGGGGQAQASTASSVRSALKHVAVENLVAGGAKKSKLLQKVFDSDAFTGTPPALCRKHARIILTLFFTLQASHLWMQSNDFSCSGYQPPACAIVLLVALLPPRQTCSSALSQ